MICEHFLVQNIENQVLTFHVDSESALRALDAPYLKSHIAEATARILNDLGSRNMVKLRWIKAHTGIFEGNETADKAAKDATLPEYTDDLPFRQVPWTTATIREPRSVMKSHIKEITRKTWQTEWETLTSAPLPTCRQSKAFIPKPNPNIWKDLKSRNQSTVSRTIRFLTGHGFMRRHKHVIENRQKNDPYDKYDYDPEAECSLCQDGQPEYPIHLITDCPVLRNERHCKFSTGELTAWELPRPPEWSPAIIDFANLEIIKTLETQTQRIE